MRARNRRQQQRRRNTILTVALIIAIPVFFYGSFELFRVIDCKTATKNLEFMNRCIENENCTLRPHELQKVESYTRMQLARCPSE